MARFIFDCEDEICLPAAYRLVDEVKNFVEKMKSVEIDVEEAKGGKNAIFKKIVENMMVHHPADTGRMFSKLWVLDEGEKAPNVFRTMNELFTNEVALDFFTCVLPSLLSLSRKV
jgi:hypothetical protein